MAYKPIKLPSASAPAISQARIEDFLGVDFTNQPSNVDEVRSPDATNMIRDVPGKVRKRMGWHTVGKVTGRVNGWHELYEKPPWSTPELSFTNSRWGCPELKTKAARRYSCMMAWPTTAAAAGSWPGNCT